MLWSMQRPICHVSRQCLKPRLSLMIALLCRSLRCFACLVAKALMAEAITKMRHAHA